ncbi:MAG: aldo/keto reductase [Bacteroidales bacterium]|uniref:aldo/keto reductase n=1 Tax=Sodaliphilus sp. TaxID=2815818 RepID=UPI001B7167A9|nr:aldo/keto reductase [Candidatus Sodaliphilus limicaballi]
MDKKILSRRSFLKAVGLGGATVAAGSIVSCATGEKQENPTEPPVGQMTYRTNPKNNEKVSILGYGMMRLPTVDSQGSAREDGDAEIDQEMVNRQVDYAIEHGVNYFDTSPAYCKGRSEHCTGIALARHKRDEFIIATKLSNFAPETWTHEAGVQMFQNSLKELQVDYIDYLLLHAVGGGDDPEDAMKKFNARYIDNGVLDYLLEQREKGVIKNLGFSYHGHIEVYDYLLSQHDKYKWDFVQIQLNYFDWKNAAENDEDNAEYLYNELVKRNIPAIIMEPLLGGRLAKLPDPLAAKLLQREPERSVASWAFRYAGTHPGVLTVLSGMTFMEHLKDNLKSYCPLKPLSDEEMKFLEGLGSELASYETVPCTACKYCMPCPYGINIPAIFSHYNKCLTEGNAPQEKTSPTYARERRAFLVGYDRSVPRLRQADHCIGCGQCSPHCPQRIDIPRELNRISDYVDRLKREGE